MKDRLERTGRRNGYRKLMMSLRVFLIALGGLGTLALPIGISYSVATAKEANKAKVVTTNEALKENLAKAGFHISLAD